MAQARWWLFGLIPLALLWFAALDTDALEKDLASRVSAVLASSPWVPSSLTAHGRDITLGGDAFDGADRAATIAAADDVRGVRLVDDASRLVPEAHPFAWSATKAQGAITLAGDVPKPQDRTTIFATAGAAGKVTDLAVYAGGAPHDFTVAATQLAGLLVKMTEGKVSLDGTDVSVKGVADDKAAGDAIEAALAKLPAGYNVKTKDIQVPAYTFDADKTPVTNSVTLTGTLPDTATREKVLAAARRMFVGQNLVDRTKLEAGAPNGFAATVTTGLEQLARLDGGHLKISETTVALSGSALYERAVGQIKSALDGLPHGFEAKTDLSAKPQPVAVDPSTCQQHFDDLLSKGTVQFETGSAKVDRVSAGVLDRLVAIAEQCPSRTLDVSGHTDAAGNDAFNMDLSKRRAQAVVDYLVAAGLDTGHLTATGYGKTKPVASNDTEDGRAKNRRIEFLVK